MAESREDLRIVRRRSHYLVYHPNEGWSKSGDRALNKHLCVWERVTETFSNMRYRAAIYDVDPRGRSVLRLPGGLPPELIAGAWPEHLWEPQQPASRGWPAREVSFLFRSGEFPFDSKNQRAIYEYLADPVPGTFLVEAPTGEGKSYATIRAWHQHGEVLLGTFAQSLHMQNFKAEILKFTDVTEDQILVVDDGMKDIRRVIAEPERALRYKAALVLHRTVSNATPVDRSDPWRPVAVGRCEFVDFAQALGVGLHVSDEVQLELQSLVDLSLMANFRRTVYLSATPGRTEHSEDKVLKAVLPMQTRLTVAAPRRHVVRQLAFDSKPEDCEVRKCIAPRHGAGFMSPPYFDYFTRSDKWGRWRAMVGGLVRSCFDEGAQGVAVVVSGKLEFLAQVVEAMREDFPDRTVGNFSSLVDKKVRMGELDRDIIVSTEKSFNGSINPPRTSHMINLAPVASPVWTEQIAGRLRGRAGMESVLLDVWDRGFQPLREQAARRRTVYRKKIAKELTEGEVDF